MRPFIVTAPTGDLVSISDLLDHVVGSPEHSVLISGLQKAAVAHLDGYTGRLGRCILKQKWALPLFDAPDEIYLPFPDCRDFKFESKNDAGVWSEVLGPSVLPLKLDHLAVSDLPADTSSLYLTCNAGWESVEDVPSDLKLAVSMLVGHWYENRIAVSEGPCVAVPLGFEAMISPYKNIFV